MENIRYGYWSVENDSNPKNSKQNLIFETNSYEPIDFCQTNN